MSQTYETTREVNIHYRLPDGKAFVTLPPELIKATLNGRGWDLFSDFIAHPSPEISFEVEDFHSLTIDRTQLFARIKQAISSEVKITEADIDFILFNYQNSLQKKVPVVFEDSIAFAPGYYFQDSVGITPDSVLVYGPHSLVDSLTSWPTVLFKQEELKVSLQEEWPLQPPIQGQISLSPPKIVLDIPVEEYTEKSLFVPVVVKNGKDSIRIFPAQIQVKFVVGVSRFNSFNSEDFLIETDFKDVSLNDANNTIPLTFNKIPEGISGLNYTPKSVEFFIVQKTNNSTTTDTLNQAENLIN